MHRPVFYDPSGGRSRWSLRLLVMLLAAIAAAAALFATTIVNVPAGSPLALRFEHPAPLPLRGQIAGVRHHIAHGIRALGRWLPRGPAHPAGARPLTVGFYVPWDDASRTSLAAHAGALDWVAPSLIGMTGPAHALHIVDDPGFDHIIAAAARRPKVLPVLQNAANGVWDSADTAAMLHDPAARARLIAQLGAPLDHEHAAGIVFDFEALPRSAISDYLLLLGEAHRALAARGLIVTVTVPVGDADWPLAAFARVADRIFLMDYDEHWQGGSAGPIASQPWFIDRLREGIARIGRDRLIVGIANYAYDWHGHDADALSVEEAWLAAHDSGAPVAFDAASGNAGFAYRQGDEVHSVWMLDAASAWNQLRAVQALGVPGVALWRLGSEDPGIWSVLAGYRSGLRPALTAIRPVANVDVEGSGEILRITATPQNGARQLRYDRTGMIRDEHYLRLPTPYVVRRTGDRPKLVALTFDDGPDATWTPRILNILESAHVPATFFVIGENALQHPGLLRRIVDDGSEIGNHSTTHPNMAEASAADVRIELNATQRMIEAYTGHATRLFRAPYFGDAEPTTADELDPALIAQQQGYTVVGLHVDPGDWKRPGVDAIVRATLDQIADAGPERSANVVLLHDGGGDRAQTVAALPTIIRSLEARGYRFVPVSTLAGLTPAAVMPRIGGGDLAAVRLDVAMFRLFAALGYALKWLFFAAIALGMGRALLMAALAVRESRRAPMPPVPMDRPLVSVIIPAFNEARVIESAVRRVLASAWPAVELIVADDGSHDRTSAIVASRFGGDPRVRLLTLANGGKAAALNRALAVANGAIIVALDADTQFEPQTIARLARWFADPDIGAVAGNAKVGNRVNLVTRWQAVEYVTAQNVERRALAAFDAITVVPGAVGAWRRAALDDVGGYPEDTLAEDQDLTIAIQRAGWRVAYDADAVAWTEAPETLRALGRQRYRWAFGTLQCLWKHRAILRTRTPAGLALVGLPQAWLFQILFAVISPVIDLALVLAIAGTAVAVHQHGWAQTESDVLRMALYWLVFTAVDVACGWIAYRLEPRERHFPALLLVAQRIVYRQLMYGVVLRAVAAAIGGLWVGWGKLERSGRVEGSAEGQADRRDQAGAVVA